MPVFRIISCLKPLYVKSFRNTGSIGTFDTPKGPIMDIVIAGAGDVGFHLSRWLSGESHNITLIDRDDGKLSYVDSHIDAITIIGDVTDFRILQQAKVQSADLFISVTSYEDVNITSAIYAKKMGAKQTIARISNMQYLINSDILNIRDLGIDELISPESLAAREVRHLLRTNAASESIDFENGKITLLGLDIDDDAEVVGKSMAEIAQLSPERKYVVVALIRKDETIIPKGHTKVEVGDHLFVITHAEGMEDVLAVTGKRKIKIKNIIVLGGSRTGTHLARKLSRNYNVKLIEKDAKRAEAMAAEFPNVMVLNFDGTEVETLVEEGVAETDAFVAVTGNSETNILTCLVAKEKGAKKTIAMVENIDYLSLSQAIGIDSLINKKLAAANFIYRYIRRGDIITLSTLHGVNAEVMEFQVHEKSKITKHPIKDLGLPEGSIIGGVVRDNKGLIPTGDFHIHAGDRVVVFASNNCSHKMDKFFR